MFVYIGGQVTFTAVTNIRGGGDTFIYDPITIMQQMSAITHTIVTTMMHARIDTIALQ